jgi:hypothetical protein
MVLEVQPFFTQLIDQSAQFADQQGGVDIDQ